MNVEGLDTVVADVRYAHDPVVQQQMKVKLEKNDFFNSCLAPQMLQMKVGAQVLLLRNLDLTGAMTGGKQLVNGSRYGTWHHMKQKCLCVSFCCSCGSMQEECVGHGVNSPLILACLS